MKRALPFATNLIFALLLAVPFTLAAEQNAISVKSATEKKADVVPTITPAVELLDINSATEKQLQAIPGIGAESAKKIIAGRPYVKKDQLKSRKIVPEAVYNKIKSRIIAKKPYSPAPKQTVQKVP